MTLYVVYRCLEYQLLQQEVMKGVGCFIGPGWAWEGILATAGGNGRR